MAISSDSKLLRTAPYIGLVALIDLMLVMAVISTMGWNADGVLHLSRYTARTSFFLFLLVFLASSLAYWAPGDLTRNLRTRRRSLGLGFAFAHLVHLGVLTAYFIVSNEKPPMATIIGGGIGYVFVILMALTSSDAAMQALGRGWKTLHKTGLYYIWFIFAFTYLTRLFKIAPLQPRWVYAIFFSLLISALVVRLAAPLSRRLKRAEQAG